MAQRILGFGVLLACLVSRGVVLHACSCAEASAPCSATWDADAVFVGQVVEIIQPPAGIQSTATLDDPVVVTLRVQERFRGVDTDSVVVRTGQGGGDCGYAFNRVGTYLIYAHRSTGTGQLTTGICSRTRRIDQASEDLEYLRGLARDASALGTLQGLASRRDPNDMGFMGNGGPISGALVTVESVGATPSFRSQTTTGPDGRWAMRAPIGRYQATLDPGPRLYVATLPNRLTAELKDSRGCAEFNFRVRSDGRLGGRILDSTGAPVPNLTVDLLSFRRVNDYTTATARAVTDASGTFAFSRLPPDWYIVGLLVRRVNLEPGQAIWLSPSIGGVPQSVRVGIEAEVWSGDFTVPPSVELMTVAGRVESVDRQSVATAKVYLMDKTGSIVGGPAISDAAGTFTLTVVAGREYSLTAEHGSGRELRRVSTGRFTAVGLLDGFVLRFGS